MSKPAPYTATHSWIDLFDALNSPQFAESASGVPILDRKLVLDEFAGDVETSSNWKFADVCMRFTRQQQDLIEQVRLLASAPTPAYFPILFQSTETLLPEVESSRNVAWMIRVDAQVAIHLRDADRAFRSLVTLFALSKHVDAVPFAISRLVGIAMRRMALRTLQHAIQLDLFTDQQHNKLPISLDELPEIAGVLSPFGNRPFGYTITNRQSVLWGFDVSKEHQQTPSRLPVTDQPNADSLRNRELVWWFNFGADAN